MPAKKNSTISDSTAETEKIYITLPKKYVTILEIIAGEPRNKSAMIEKMIDDYIDFRKETLIRDEKYNKILAVLRGSPTNNSIEEMIAFIDTWAKNHLNNKELNEIWLVYRTTRNETKITDLYQRIMAHIATLEEKIDDIITI